MKVEKDEVVNLLDPPKVTPMGYVNPMMLNAQNNLGSPPQKEKKNFNAFRQPSIAPSVTGKSNPSGGINESKSLIRRTATTTAMCTIEYCLGVSKEFNIYPFQVLIVKSIN